MSTSFIFNITVLYRKQNLFSFKLLRNQCNRKHLHNLSSYDATGHLVMYVKEAFIFSVKSLRYIIFRECG